MPHARFSERRDKVRKAIRKLGIEGLLVSGSTNVSYLTGFSGEDAHLLIFGDCEILVSDGRFTSQLEEECPDLRSFIRPPHLVIQEAISSVLRAGKIGKLGIEGDSITVGLRDKIAEKLPNMEMVSTSGVVEQFRQIKDKEEIEAIRVAVRQAEKAFAAITAAVTLDKTEKEVADDLEYTMRRLGARGVSFPTIVAVGARAALPHGRPSEVPLRESDLVLVDWGADAGPYKSDLTRVLITGKISPKLERLYRVVLKAQLKAIAAIRPGVAMSDVDRVARKVIEDEGFGRYFTHGLGHGIGMQVHEAPRLAPKVQGDLRPGMVVTVEPGIYLPGWGGIRIEDDVLVTRLGHEVLTSVAKDLDEIVVR